MDDLHHTPALVTVVIFCSIAFAKNTKRQKESYASFLWSRFCHSHEKVLDGLGNLGFISKTSSRYIRFCFFLPFWTVCRSLRLGDRSRSYPLLTTNHNSRWVIYFCLVCSLL